MIKPGDVLLNGATVISVLHVANTGSLALCYWEESTTPWVVWRVDYQGYAFWGNYYSNSADAADKFNKRAEHLMSDLDSRKNVRSI